VVREGSNERGFDLPGPLLEMVAGPNRLGLVCGNGVDRSSALILDLQAIEPRVSLVSELPGKASALAWSSSGEFLAVADLRCVRVFDLKGNRTVLGRNEGFFDPRLGNVRGLYWRDEKTLLVIRSIGQNGWIEVYALKRKGGKPILKQEMHASRRK